MYKVGDKFIIEIDSVMTNKKGELYGIKGFNSLVFSENELDRLEKAKNLERLAYDEGYSKAAKDYFKQTEVERESALQTGYDKGLLDAWECLKKLKGKDVEELKEVFNLPFIKNVIDVLVSITPQEAVEKLKAWETFQEIKKECEGCPAWDGYDCSRTQEEGCLKEIKVGDVIKSRNENTAVIQYIDAWDRWECFSKNGGSFTLDHEKQRLWKKTGKHIDLTEIFEGLGGRE